MKIIFTIISSVLIFSCSSPKTEVKAEKKIVKNESEPTNLEKLKTESSRLRAGGSIKKIDFIEGKAIVEYVKNYKEYKELNPQSGLTKSDLDNYWSSGDAIEKALIDGSVRLMKKLDFVNDVEIILPYKGKKYSLNITKSELESFIGSDFNSIKNNWDEKFSNPFVYDDEGRKEFFSRFGNIN